MPTSVIYEGDEAVAKSHLPRAQNLLHKVREFVAASGAGIYNSTLVLDDRSYTFVLKHGDVEVIHIFSQPLAEYSETKSEQHKPVDFLSGVVRGGYLRTDFDAKGNPFQVLEAFKPNAVTAKRLGASGYLDTTRLTVEYGDVLSNLAGVPVPPLRRASQYTSARPSQYSGRMQQLVQVVLGYGRLSSAQLVNLDPVTRATVRQHGVQLAYDFRFTRTHGLVIADDNEQWLVEVSAINGVLAMPLPRYPDKDLATTPDVAAVIREFGGLPTGQGFPVGAALTDAIAAGTVLQLLPREALDDVYVGKAAYYSSCGWAFSRAGSEAHITCWNYGEDKMKRSFHYALRIAIGAVNKQRKAGEPLAKASAGLRLVSTGRIYYPSTLLDPPEVYPQPPFRIYEPLRGKLLTFMLAPGFSGNEDEPDYSKTKFICDTTVHVYFAEDDDLKLVKYYYDHRELDTNTVTGEAPGDIFSYIGEHTYIKETGVRTVPPAFYTTDYDIRREVVTQRQTTITGGGVLFPTPPYMTDGPGINESRWLPPIGAPLDTPQPATDTVQEVEQMFAAGWRYGTRHSMGRSIYVQVHSTVLYETDPYVRSGIVIPDGIREGITIVLYEHGAYQRGNTSDGLVVTTDDYSYGWREYDDGLGINPPVTRKVDGEDYASGDTQGVFDLGQWATVGGGVPTFVAFDFLPLEYALSQKSTTSLTHKFTLTLFTGHIPGGIVLQKIEETLGEIITIDSHGQQTSYEDTSSGPAGATASEWALWIDPNSQYPDGTPLNMAVYYSANLGERQMVYDTKLIALPEDRLSIGSLVEDVSKSPTREKFNFIGVP